MNIDLLKLSITELESLAYREMKILEVASRNVKLIETVLEKRRDEYTKDTKGESLENKSN